MILFNSIQTILASTVISGIIASLISIIAKLLIDNSLRKQLADHETKLKKEFFRFSTFHQKEVEVIGEIYGGLSEAHSLVVQLVNYIWKENEEAHKSFAEKTLKSIHKFEDYYRSHRIYLDLEICAQVDSLWAAISEAYYDYDIGKDKQLCSSGENKKIFKRAAQALDEKATPILKNLDAEFRRKVSIETN